MAFHTPVIQGCFQEFLPIATNIAQVHQHVVRLCVIAIANFLAEYAAKQSAFHAEA
jgi:hypothetical protein